MEQDRTAVSCCDIFYCCWCRRNCSPGSCGGAVLSWELNGHHYCSTCFPKAVDVYLAQQKLKIFDIISPEKVIKLIEQNIRKGGVLRKTIKEFCK